MLWDGRGGIAAKSIRNNLLHHTGNNFSFTLIVSCLCRYLIKSLVRKWGYEAASLLVDETWEEFSAVAWSDTPVFYDPKSIFPQRDFANGQDFNGYSYQTPFGGVPQRGAGNSLFAANPTTEAPT